MTDWSWTDPAELIQIPVSGKGWSGGRAPTSVMKGSVGDIVRHLRGQNIEDVWRFAIIVDKGRYLRAAELRAAIRDPACA